MKFSLGQVAITRGVEDFCEENNIDKSELIILLVRHSGGDWGEVNKEDKETNDYALEHGGRLLSAYRLKDQKVWAITEWDRSATTILFPDEY